MDTALVNLLLQSGTAACVCFPRSPTVTAGRNWHSQNPARSHDHQVICPILGAPHIYSESLLQPVSWQCPEKSPLRSQQLTPDGGVLSVGAH
ncbi:hypothetical protein FKM82_001314 [Ascaphus truei]